MAKKQEQPTKTCDDCIHEYSCIMWTDGRKIADESASRCPNYETVKESAAYLCGLLDERKRKETNAGRIRAMTDEELADYLAELGSEANNGVIYSDRPEEWLEYLKQPAKEEA